MLNLTFPLELKALDDTRGTFEGYASTFGTLDAYNDIVDPGAFATTLHEARTIPIPMLWQHNPEEPIGVIEEATEDTRGLRVRGRLVLDSARGRESYALLKAGAIRGLSIGFDTVRYRVDAERHIRHLQEIRLWECSLVTFPANPSATVSAVKSSPTDPCRAFLERIRGDINRLRFESLR